MVSIIAALLCICSTTFAQSNGETNTKTGIVLANEHKIVMEARRSSMNFDKIEVSAAIRIIVEERTTGNIIVRAPQSVMPYISLKVKDETLYATLLRGTPVSRRSNLLAEVYIPNNGRICEIEAESAARVVIKPTLVAESLEIKAKSAASVRCRMEVKKLDVELSSASTANLSGVAQRGEVEISGASTLQASKLNFTTLELECAGASRATAKADICEAESVGASSVTVECSQHLNATAKGASSIRYSGACRVNTISNTGGSTIARKE